MNLSMNSHVNYDIHYRHFNTFLSRLKFFKLTYQLTKKISVFFHKVLLIKNGRQYESYKSRTNLILLDLPDSSLELGETGVDLARHMAPPGVEPLQIPLHGLGFVVGP